MRPGANRPSSNPSSDPIMLTVHGVAALLACSARTIYRLADAGRIPRPIRIGGMVRWPREWLERWVAEGCPAPTAGRTWP